MFSAFIFLRERCIAPAIRHCQHADPQLFTRAHEQTAALTEEIGKVEKEIDERVAGLCGLE